MKNPETVKEKIISHCRCAAGSLFTHLKMPQHENNDLSSLFTRLRLKIIIIIIKILRIEAG